MRRLSSALLLRGCVVANIVAVVFTVGASSASAVSYSWLAKTGSGNWTTPVNWSGTSSTNLYPGSTAANDTASLNGDLTGDMTVNLNTSVTLQNLFIGDLSSATTSGSFFTTTVTTTNNSTLTFQAASAATNVGQINVQGGVNNGAANLVTPNLIVNSGTFEVRKLLVQGGGTNAQVNVILSGNVTSGSAGAHQLRLTPAGSSTGSSLLEYSGNITDGVGTINMVFRVDSSNQPNTLRLSGTGNTFSGGISVFGGGPGLATLESSPASGTNGALGTGVLSLGNSGSSAILNLGGSLSTVTEVCTINIPGTGTVAKRIAVIGAGNRILSGTLNQNAGAGLTLACSDAGNLTFSNAIAGTGPITISSTGSGKVIFGGNNTNTGAVTVSAGKLQLDGSLSGSSNLSVAAAAWLGGSGTASGTATIGGTLSPGSTTGVLSLGSLTLTSTSTALIDLLAPGTRGTDYDGISILNSGGLTYGGTMSLAFGGSAVPDNTTFNVFNFTGSPSGSFGQVSSTGFYAGTWTDNADGTYSLASGGQTLTFTQATGNVIVVPEPTTITLLGVGVAFAAARRRSFFNRSQS